MYFINPDLYVIISPPGEKYGLGVCAVESIPTAKAPQRSIFLFFFVA
jgi:hypothetical protein